MLLKGLGVGSRGRPADPSCGGVIPAQGGILNTEARGGQAVNESSGETDELKTHERALQPVYRLMNCYLQLAAENRKPTEFADRPLGNRGQPERLLHSMRKSKAIASEARGLD